MRILLIHSCYNIRGGEEVVFEREAELLSTRHTVQSLVFKNLPGWKGGLQFAFSIWNVFAVRKVVRAVKQFKPDIVHLHNWHFATGPAIIRAISKQHIPVVATLHNYRLLCPSGVLLHEGRVFLDSVERNFPWKAVVKRVYRNSHLQTFWLAFIVWFHKKTGTWQMVNRYITTSPYSEKLHLGSSLHFAGNKFVVKPHFVDDPSPDSLCSGEYFLYVGRLSPEKGITVLLQAFEQLSASLIIAGEGPLEGLVAEAASRRPNIRYVGVLNWQQLQNSMHSATALVSPSQCPEPFRLTIIEAFAHGLPVIASNIGAAKDSVENKVNGLHFEPGNTAELVRVIGYWMSLTGDEKKQYSASARKRYEQYYKAEENLEMLQNIYAQVVNKKQGEAIL